VRIGELLVHHKLVTMRQVEEALARQLVTGGRLGSRLVELNVLSLDQLAEALGQQHEVPVATVAALEQVSSAALGAVSRDLCAKHGVLPLRAEPTTLHLAMLDPQLLDLVDEIGRLTSMSIVQPYAIPELRLYYYLERYHRLARPKLLLREQPAPRQGDERRRYLEPTPTKPVKKGRGGPVWEAWASAEEVAPWPPPGPDAAGPAGAGPGPARAPQPVPTAAGAPRQGYGAATAATTQPAIRPAPPSRSGWPRDDKPVGPPSRSGWPKGPVQQSPTDEASVVISARPPGAGPADDAALIGVAPRSRASGGPARVGLASSPGDDEIPIDVAIDAFPPSPKATADAGAVATTSPLPVPTRPPTDEEVPLRIGLLWEPGDVVRLLGQASRREKMLEHLLLPLLPETSLQALFVLRGEFAVAQGAWGTSLLGDQVKSLVVSLEQSPLLRQARRGRVGVRGSASDDPLQAFIARYLGAAAPAEACVVPISSRGWVANLLVIQSSSRLPPDALERLQGVARAAEVAYERIGSEVSGVHPAPAAPPPAPTVDEPGHDDVTPTGFTGEKSRSDSLSGSVSGSGSGSGNAEAPTAFAIEEMTLIPKAQRTFGRYSLICRLASGGMANLYLAQLAGPEGFQKLVAIKRIHDHLSSHRDFIEMFTDEARLAARISHPNVVQVLEFGHLGATQYIAMEYVDGENVMALLRATRDVTLPVCAMIVAQAAAGLHAAHELRDSHGALLNVVHRDVSPANILLSYSGAVKVVDFGVARARSNLHVTGGGTIKGKFAYLAPEQTRTSDVDRRADIFSLGIVLFEITTRRRLFKGASDAETLQLVQRSEIPRPSSIIPDYAPSLERVVLKALAAEPAERFQTAEELQASLEDYLRETGTSMLTSTLSRLMRQVFAERIARKQALLQALELEDPL